MDANVIAEGRRLHEESKKPPFNYKLFARWVVNHADSLLAAATRVAELEAEKETLLRENNLFVQEVARLKEGKFTDDEYQNLWPQFQRTRLREIL